MRVGVKILRSSGAIRAFFLALRRGVRQKNAPAVGTAGALLIYSRKVMAPVSGSMDSTITRDSSR